MADNFINGVEDTPIEPPIQASSSFPSWFCCSCSYQVPTLRELWARDKRLLRAILVIVILLNIPVGKYFLYPFMIFSTWIHESFHGIAALSVGGSIAWLNIYPDGSGLANTLIPVGLFQRGWVASAGYQSTAIVGGIMLMFRRSNFAARISTCGVGLGILLSCLLYVRNTFGLVMMPIMGALLVLSGWKLPPFWIGELYALLSTTMCLNAVTSIRVLFFVTESSIGGVTHSSDATTMQSITLLPYWAWATAWMVLACWMTMLGVFITIEPRDKNREAMEEFCAEEDHPLALSTEMT